MILDKIFVNKVNKIFSVFWSNGSLLVPGEVDGGAEADHVQHALEHGVGLDPDTVLGYDYIEEIFFFLMKYFMSAT